MNFKKFIILLFFLPGAVYSQDVDTTKITLQKERIVVLPAEYRYNEYRNISDEILDIVSNSITALGRFEVIDRTDLNAVLTELGLAQSGIVDESQAVEVGKLLASDVGLLVKLSNFSQQGIPTKEDLEWEKKKREEEKKKGVLEKIVDNILERRKREKEEKYEYNIKTDLSVLIKKIDIERGKILDSFQIQVAHTGGSRIESRRKALNKFKLLLPNKLRRFYILKSLVIEKTGDRAIVLIGQNVGARRGIKFNVFREGKTVEIAGRKVSLPMKRLGIIKLTSISENTSIASILRGRGKIRENDFLIERLVHDFGLTINFGRSSPSGFTFGGISINYDQFNRFSPGVLSNFGQAYDTENEAFPVIFPGVFASYKIFRTDPLDIFTMAGFGLLFATARDDRGKDVNALSPVFTLGGGLDIYLSDELIIAIKSLYLLAGKISKWEIAEEEKSEDKDIKPDWSSRGYSPEIEAGGFTIIIGLKYVISL